MGVAELAKTVASLATSVATLTDRVVAIAEGKPAVAKAKEEKKEEVATAAEQGKKDEVVLTAKAIDPIARATVSFSHKEGAKVMVLSKAPTGGAGRMATASTGKGGGIDLSGLFRRQG